MQTPSKKGVRWAFDVSNSPFGGAAEPSTPETSTSSLAYVNSQIIAHGFARAPLDLSDLGRDEQNRVVKCVLGMLSQRVDDMTRAEDISTRLRTLSYEHERLGNMLRAAKSQVIQAEKETEAARTKANSLTKDLASATTAHTRTSAHLAQQTSAIAALRAASTADARKREQDVARLKERWQKLASEQSKLGSIGSGLICANWAVVDGNEQYVGGGGGGEEVGEGAMRDAVEARERLTEENDVFREVLVKILGVVGEHLKEREVKDVKIPSAAALFQPPATEDDAGPALNAYRILRDLVHHLAISTSTTSAAHDEEERALARSKAEEHRVEIRAWEQRVDNLEREVARLTGELAASNDFAEKGRILIEQMANDRKVLQKNVEEHAAGETAALAAQRQELEDERAKFTDAAIRLARERSEFEAERLQYAEEKREWAMRRVVEVEEMQRGPPFPEAHELEDVLDENMAEPEPEPEVETVPESKPAPVSKPGPSNVSKPGPKPGPGPAPKPGPGLGDALRTVLKAEKDAERKKRREERGRLMKPSSPAKSKIGKRGREGEQVGGGKKARSGGPPLPPQPVFNGGLGGKVVVGGGTSPKRGKGSSSVQAGQEAEEASSSAPPDKPPSPKRLGVPVTPRSLHPAAQKAKARHYAPAVPSPLSRILSMAESPEERRGGGASGVGVKSPPGMNAEPGIAPGMGTGPGTGAGGSRPKSGLAVKFAAAAAAKAKIKEGKEPRVVPLSESERAETSKGNALESEDKEAGASKGMGKEAETSKGKEVETSKGKGKERAREEEEREKDEGRDLDAIFAPRPGAGPSGAGPSTRSGIPTKGGKQGGPMRVALKRGATPRKAAVGGVRAKRAAGWRG
ncbi:hypothetical protein FRC12_012164 [Ceratobasidium sp. 428]|nr:hypothetical protein FRC12_012164 [Ceratobasidium sp. 428]